MSCVLMSTKYAKGSVGEGEKGKKAYKWTLKAFTVTSWILRQTFFIRMSQFINLLLWVTSSVAVHPFMSMSTGVEAHLNAYTRVQQHPELNLKQSKRNDTVAHTHTHTETYTHLPLRHWHTLVIVTDTHQRIDRGLCTYMTSYLRDTLRKLTDCQSIIDKTTLLSINYC